MSDSDDSAKKHIFTKRSHRPWKRDLLEATVNESVNDLGEGSVGCDVDGSGETKYEAMSEEIMATLQHLDSDEESIVGAKAIPHKDGTPGRFDDLNSQIQTVLAEKEQQKRELIAHIEDTSSSNLLLGGFFQPSSMDVEAGSEHGKKIGQLMTDLKSKELELMELSSNLKIVEAIEQAEQAELAKIAEEKAKLNAESRMRQAIEQAHRAAAHLKKSVEQASEAEIAQREEEKLRKIAENKISEAIELSQQHEESMKNAQELQIKAENDSKAAYSELAEIKSKYEALHKQEQTVKKNLQMVQEKIQQSEMNRAAEEAARTEAEDKYVKLNQVFKRIDEEHKASLAKVDELEDQVKELTDQKQLSEKKLLEALDQKDKLQSIISSEKELRAMAEKRMREAVAQASRAEMARKAEEKQRKLVDERAKRAVAHASRTVMHFLNAPLDGTEASDNPKGSGKKGKKSRKPISEEEISDLTNNEDFE